MHTISAVLIALAVSASANPEETLHQREMREHYNHLHYIGDFPCHHPQARTIPIHELLSPYQTRGKAYFPDVTVLHRCDMFAGCCEGAKKCTPLHADNVHIPFKVTYLEDMGGKHKGDWNMEYYPFDNHTVCHCYYHHELNKEHDLEHHGHEDHELHQIQEHHHIQMPLHRR